MASFSKGEAYFKVCHGKSDAELKMIQENLYHSHREPANLGVLFLVATPGILVLNFALFM